MVGVSEVPSPHVLIFPLPLQGHVNSMLRLAELLALAGIKVTFLNSKENHERLVRFTDVQQRFSKYPGFQLQGIPDGFETGHPRGSNNVMQIFEDMELKTKPVLKEMLIKATPPVTCIIGDGVVGLIVDVALELGIPIIHFRTISACCFWTYFCLPDVIAAGELPIKETDEDMNRLITKVPGMENFLRRRDLPKLPDPALQLAMNETRKSLKVQSLILNTFEDLEAPILSHIRTHCPKTYTIGPHHELLKIKLQRNELEPHKSSNSLWEESKTSITWLDSQPSGSVLYVNFGSITVMTTKQLLEFWHGLINSKKKFLWVIRGDSVEKEGNVDEKIPEELVRGIMMEDYMVVAGWVPQEEVLGHKAVGGFLTHSGWNSSLESIMAGVPMICWPYFADQQVNSRFVGEVWKLGLDMKDICDRRVIEKFVNDIMVVRREEFVSSAAKMAELAKKSISPGGSSYCNLDSLIEDIRSMTP